VSRDIRRVFQNKPRTDTERDFSDFSVHISADWISVSTTTTASSNTQAFKLLAEEVGGDSDSRFDDLKTTKDITVCICGMRF
jgi:hypothetical protein